MFYEVKYYVRFANQDKGRNMFALMRAPNDHLIEQFLKKHLENFEKDIIRFYIKNIEKLDVRDVIFEEEV